MIWLCAGCTSTHTVQSWRGPGEQIRRRASDARTLSFDQVAEAQMVA
jgi:hypothetical protein